MFKLTTANSKGGTISITTKKSFAEAYGSMTVGQARKFNNKVGRQEMKKSINWEKVIAFGVGLGYVASTLYLLTLIAARVA